MHTRSDRSVSGHDNPFEGYHYHAATGCSKKVPNKDGHSPMLGYALDGFGIYARLSKNGKEPENLDECGEHVAEKAAIIKSENRAITKSSVIFAVKPGAAKLSNKFEKSLFQRN